MFDYDYYDKEEKIILDFKNVRQKYYIEKLTSNAIWKQYCEIGIFI